jgi:hypothetical protein
VHCYSLFLLGGAFIRLCISNMSEQNNNQNTDAQSRSSSGPGYAIDRRYRVVRELGQGAYGLVV